MKKNVVLIVLSVILTGFIFGTTTPETTDPINTLLQQKYLNAEYELAQSAKLYFIIDMVKSIVQVKANGLVLREWQIVKRKFWGDPIPITGIPLHKKSTLFPPKRENIKPGQVTPSKDFKLDTLEVVDMPSTYTLIMEGGIKIYIKSKPEGFFRIFTRAGHWLRWTTASPFFTLWNTAGKKKYTALDIELSSTLDVKSLYWVFTEGSRCLFILPKELSTPAPQ